MDHTIHMYVVWQPVTGLPIQHIIRWPHFDVFRKIPKQLFLIQIYNRYIFVCLCKNRKDTKHMNNFSRCINSIENII